MNILESEAVHMHWEGTGFKGCDPCQVSLNGKMSRPRLNPLMMTMQRRRQELRQPTATTVQYFHHAIDAGQRI